MEKSPCLRILQISHDYEGPFRAVCRQYATACAGHHVTTVYICGKRSPEVEAVTGGDEVIFFEQSRRSIRGLKLSAMVRLLRLMRDRRFDVVIAHRYKPTYLAGVLSLFIPIPVLLGVFHEHRVFRRFTRRLFIRFWRRNIICVGVSGSVSRDIERDCGPLMRQGRLFTLHHAVDVARAAELTSAVEARQRLGAPQDAFCFGTVGRLVAKKDYPVLIDGFRQFLDANPGHRQDTSLVIVGAGPEDARLRNLVRDHRLDDCVVFAGSVADAWHYMMAFDTFVMPSSPAEAFGMVLLEAMLAGRPVISSDSPGPAEVVGDAALLFSSGSASELADRLARVRAMAPEDLARLGRSGRDRLTSEFTPESFRQRLWQIPQLQGLTVGNQ